MEPEAQLENNSENTDATLAQELELGSPRRREKLVEMMREEIHFSEEAIVRFARTRLQIDTDY